MMKVMKGGMLGSVQLFEQLFDQSKYTKDLYQKDSFKIRHKILVKKEPQEE